MPSAVNLVNERRLRIAETISVLARLLVVALLLFGAWMANVEMGRVERTQDMLAHIDAVQRNLLRSQVSHRTFLLAGDSAAWNAYAVTAVELDASIAALDKKLDGDTAQLRRLRDFSALLDRLKVYRNRAHAGAAPTADSATASLRGADRTQVRLGLDATLTAMQRSAQAQLFENSAAQHRTIRLLLFCALAAVVLAVVIGLGTLRFRRSTTAQLMQAESMFRRLSDDNPDGVLLLVNQTIAYANAAAEALLGAPTGALSGRDVMTVVHPDDRSVVGQRVAGVMADGIQSTPRALRYLRLDGSEIEVEVRGAKINYQGKDAIQVVMRDLTIRRETERALRDSESRYRLLAEHSADLISRRDNDNVITYASPSHAAVLGWSPDELLGTDAAALVHPEDLARVRAVRDRSVADARAGTGMMTMLRIRHKNGHYVWLEVAATPLVTTDGQPDGHLVSARDATARLALEDELRQSQKMEVLGRMASGVAHDFNNLLTVIRSSAELLRVQEDGLPVPLDVVSDIELATDRAAALTTHLLMFSRSQHYAPARLRFARLVRDAAPILSRLAGDRVHFVLDVDDSAETAWMWADKVRLDQVLVNLVGNARDAMPDGGLLRIACSAVTLRDSVSHRFGAIAPGQYLTLAVEDQGTGMTDEVLAHLFDPFYTTKPQGRGTGLGLSIVYGVVTEAHGSITVTSEAGRGSRFTVYWPRADAPAAQDTESKPDAEETKSTPLPEPRENGKRILLVDDDDSVRRVIARQIAAAGYAVESVNSAAAALDILRRRDAQFDALVTDVRMPEMTGIELVAQLIADGIELPVLLVSGQLDSQLPEGWPATLQRQFLSKPISGLALHQALADLIAPYDAEQLLG